MEKKVKLTEQKTGFAHQTNGQGDADEKEQNLDELRDSLAARLRSGDHSAAEEFVDMYNEQIFLFMRRLGHDRQVSEDLTQESFLQAWQHISQLRNGKALNGWLYRIAGNVSRLYWRRHKGKEMASIEGVGIDIPEDNEAGPDIVEHHEQLTRLKKVVEYLPEKLRQAVVLHYMQHLTIAEAAEAAGVREGTFKSRLNRALETLRKQVL
ncbi:MAG: sigma-70 family RNA polymerase sigma factor [Phycisphaerae bacterium]|nr:RNA polymerase sigma factor [Phycisphaerae bacterium]NIR62289.1 RNA polymerase sigma factor [candidate division Zixibacteria bacterium]NIP50756.1 RNA polymerase sigma factor [Phycisphaerae bacterium]NIS49924.1 RNA polymerase sigma factor [Phycisphaerae bacterium]NIU07631.1 RNA polymerase sigma factor [Phycisphaerae bacterium]